MKKVFFFDVDGTLLPHGNEKGVDEKTIYALNYLKEAGHDVVIATGKSESMIKKQIEAIDATNHITMNGAQIVINNEVKHVEKVSRETLEQLKQVAAQENLMLGCQKRDEYYMVDICIDLDLADEILSKVSLDVPVVKPDFAKEDVISQLWFLGDHTNLDLEAPIAGGHKLLKWHDMGCDVVIDYVSKAFAIEKYLDIMYPNIEVETYAFGDGFNDLEMLQMVDHSVAMGNSVGPLKEAAKYIADSCENLGVYKFLLQQNLIKE